MYYKIVIYFGSLTILMFPQKGLPSFDEYI
jgi:hypothetical protein